MTEDNSQLGHIDKSHPLYVVAIDDDDEDLELLRDALLACDEFAVEFVGYGDWKSGLKALEKCTAHVIFLDYFLGGTTGTELLKELRLRNDLRPVIMLTGNSRVATATESIRFGATDYLAKDTLSPDLLTRAIKRAHREYALRLKNAQLEKELSASRNLEAIGTLAGGVAHDFNNILASIMASTELALSFQPTPPTANELKQIMGVVANASEVIQRLLRFNKAYANPEGQVSIDLSGVIEDTFALVERFCPKGITMSVENAWEDSMWVLGNTAELHQILLNLCMNAIEAMGNSGTLAIRVHRHTIPTTPDSDSAELRAGDYACISVSDTGGGIPDSMQEQIFHPFFTTKELGEKRGTGLGLATVWDCAHDMGGTVRVESTVGEGTTFRVFLPLGDSPPPPPLKAPDEANESPRTILLADDEAVVRDNTSRLLERKGHTILCARNGVEALELVESYGATIDIIILDISMPVMDGEACLRALREQHSTVPVLITTGHSAAGELERFLDLGAAGIVQKPFNIKTLLKRIYATLGEAPPQRNI